jgi:hypothetical protein
LRTVDFCHRVKSLYGSGWRAKFGRIAGVNYATVKRWANGDSPVPGPVAALIEALEHLVEATGALPPQFR